LKKLLAIVILPSQLNKQMKIVIINGPNLNLLGLREPEIYGSTSFETFYEQLKKKYSNIELLYFQSNIEGEIIDYIHSCLDKKPDGIILNAGAYTHTSIAIADSISSVAIPCIEVHLSNIMAREDFRKTSYIASKCIGSISGLGLDGYNLAIQFLINKQKIND
jgi:3-dehydroquinate dehydratase II